MYTYLHLGGSRGVHGLDLALAAKTLLVVSLT